MPKSVFQSYLITGSQRTRRQKTSELAKSLGINLGKPSPDIYYISPNKRNHLTIDKVRELKNHLFLKPVKENYKFVLVEEAQTLTVPAQNALLKIIEEPPNQVILVLETENESQLLETLKSRVILIKTKKVSFALQNSYALFNSQGSLKEILEEIPKISDAPSFLDEQIVKFHQKLLSEVSKKDTRALKDTAYFLEKFKEAKEMVAANVNAQFVLFNLIFLDVQKFKNSASK